MATTETIASGAVARARGFWTAPADRPRGRPGVRGRLAAVVALLGIAVLTAGEWHGSTGGGGGAPGGSFSFTATGWQDWAETAFLLCGVGLLIAAAILWRARVRPVALLGVALVTGSLAATARTITLAGTTRPVSVAVFASVRTGISRDALERRLGAPWTTDASLVLGSGRRLPCDIYYRQGGDPSPPWYLFCFRGSRLAMKFAQ